MAQRHFLFLQGPHGPFFDQLAEALRDAGHGVAHVGFNAGDQAYWRDRATYTPFKDKMSAWPDFIGEQLAGKTDLVLYGDVRARHAQALQIAKQRGLRIHVFEEGYIRPYWVTYERGGSSGNSHLMNISMPQIERAIKASTASAEFVPSHWGELRQHSWYGMIYHMRLFFGQFRYPNYQPHRSSSLFQDFKAQLFRFVDSPRRYFLAWSRWSRLRRLARPMHVALLQLAHDASFQAHSSFDSLEDYVDQVIEGFARSAPTHHILLFKAHPLQHNSARLARRIAKRRVELDLQNRVHYLDGGKLGEVLSYARSVITINSTAAHQAFWRGLPVMALGDAIYKKLGLTSPQDLDAFFDAPAFPDREAYQKFRSFLMQTSQVRGGFYAQAGRELLLRSIVDRMLDSDEPYAVCDENLPEQVENVISLKAQ